MIDKHAIVDPSAKIAEDAIIGPFAVIGPDVEIGARTWVGPHVVIKGPTRIGEENKIYQFASIGEDPQDKKYGGEPTLLEIGHRNVIREYCTLNRGTVQDAGVTKIGNDNLLMSYVHIAHDCVIGNNTIFSNNASLAGHVHVDDYVILGGFAGIHQFCRLAKYCFVSSGALVLKDVPPFVRVAGAFAKPFGLNVEGLKRHGFKLQTVSAIKNAYKIIYRQGLSMEEALEKLKPIAEECAEVGLFVDLLETTKRGIVR